MLNDPKPLVVGIAWVVECVERREKVDEERFKIDVDLINVAGGNNKVLPSHFDPLRCVDDDCVFSAAAPCFRNT